MALDGDTLLTFQVHVVQNLVLHLTGTEGAGKFQQAVCQRGLTVIYMCNDAKVADVLHKTAKITQFWKMHNVHQVCQQHVFGCFCASRLPKGQIQTTKKPKSRYNLPSRQFLTTNWLKHRYNLPISPATS